MTTTITPDSNVLVRCVVADDPDQLRRAIAELEAASLVVLTLPTLCELCWVLRSRYEYATPQIRAAVEGVIAAVNVKVDEQAVEVGLAMLARGGDFADGVIAFLGRREGAREFVSFDRKAIARIKELGGQARPPMQVSQA